MKFYVDCVGCEQRQLDAQRIIDYLGANGHERAETPAAADYSFLVTCGVDNSAEKASLSRLSEIAAETDRLVVSGCLPDISPDKLRQYGDFPSVSPRRLEELDSHMASYVSIPMREIAYPNSSIFDSRADPSGLSGKLTPRGEYDMAKKGYKIRVNNGCLMDCSYCVIKDAMGRVISVPFDTLVSQFQAAADRKEPTIMFMGGDTGAYGYDVSPGTRFHSLLQKTLEIPGDHKVFVHDFNVNWYLRDARSYDDVFSRNAEHGRLRSVMLPVQSGSNRILKLMKRPYTHEAVEEKVGNMRKNHPSMHLGTHIIAGFPSESESDFDATVSLLDKIGFDFISCFVYSDRDGAGSSGLGSKVDNDSARRRAHRIAELFGDGVRVFE